MLGTRQRKRVNLFRIRRGPTSEFVLDFKVVPPRKKCPEGASEYRKAARIWGERGRRLVAQGAASRSADTIIFVDEYGILRPKSGGPGGLSTKKRSTDSNSRSTKSRSGDIFYDGCREKTTQRNIAAGGCEMKTGGVCNQRTVQHVLIHWEASPSYLRGLRLRLRLEYLERRRTEMGPQESRPYWKKGKIPNGDVGHMRRPCKTTTDAKTGSTPRFRGFDRWMKN